MIWVRESRKKIRSIVAAANLYSAYLSISNRSHRTVAEKSKLSESLLKKPAERVEPGTSRSRGRCVTGAPSCWQWILESDSRTYPGTSKTDLAFLSAPRIPEIWQFARGQKLAEAASKDTAARLRVNVCWSQVQVSMRVRKVGSSRERILFSLDSPCSNATQLRAVILLYNLCKSNFDIRTQLWTLLLITLSAEKHTVFAETGHIRSRHAISCRNTTTLFLRIAFWHLDLTFFPITLFNVIPTVFAKTGHIRSRHAITWCNTVKLFLQIVFWHLDLILNIFPHRTFSPEPKEKFARKPAC